MDIALLQSLDNLDFREWCELTSSTKKCIDFCQNVGLIGFTLNEPCAQGHNNWKLGSSARASDEYVWRCGKCKSTRTLRQGTFFFNSKLSLRQVLDLMYFWSQQIDSHTFLRRHFDRRDAATLLPIIYEYIRPGTTIYSDQWAAYNGIANGPGPHRYNHQTVNHSENFVDPTTSTHTQNIENLWMCMKRKKKAPMGQHVTLLGTHLIEFMWRQRFGDHPFENLVRAIQEKYVVQ
ncbi:unnamed protein product [Rotaria sp. Silwood2]|nr:unnamed protein product [Rotaria sp. Silwood2]CAF4402024.1 unnamed protein product [Rotaria sp. Silwood2]